MNNLKGKSVLISGGARGIGAAAAKCMAEGGGAILIGDILEDRGQETAKAIQDAGGTASFVPLDVTSEVSWSAAIAAATNAHGKLDILVNNAGIFLGRDLEDASLDDWNKLVSINMTGVFLGTKLAIPALKAAGENSPHGSAIVNLSSVAGLVGSQLDPLYSMTKGGVTTFTKASALNLARKGYRIRVNSVHPGVIDTEMGEQTFVARAAQRRANDVEAARKTAISGHPIGRLGRAEDIANGICFLASDDAGFMTGSSLVVDGGMTAQ
jgi:NAD(P)-dependent dehydrogenase (short-subunit alcohol dehydrogenase family)